MDDVLILTPSGRDQRWMAEVLGDSGMTVRTCQSSGQLLQRLDDGAACAVLAQSQLDAPMRTSLQRWLQAQPSWSDMPFVLWPLETDSADTDALLAELGHACVLNWPVNASGLCRAVHACHRARRRQYMARDQVQQLGVTLAQRIAERTDDLEQTNGYLARELGLRERVLAAQRQVAAMVPAGGLTEGISREFDKLLGAVVRALDLIERVAAIDPGPDGPDGPAAALERGGRPH